MTQVRTSIDVTMPVRSVYNQWTQFEDFPRFMDGVESVTQLDDMRLRWVASIGGVSREWLAKIVLQEPDRMIAWRSTEGPDLAGLVTFEELIAGTRITLQMDFDPSGLAEAAGDLLGIWQRRVEGDLERFKEFLEERGMETGEWRGAIEGGRVVELDPPAVTSMETEGPVGELVDERPTGGQRPTA